MINNRVWKGFTIYTGKKDGVDVSIISTGMGFPMMDFAIREARAVIDGTMAVIRLVSIYIKKDQETECQRTELERVGVLIQPSKLGL